MRKPDFGLCENKGADQLCSNCTADQRLCFRYSDRTISLHPKYKCSSFQPSPVTVQAGLCRALSETPKTGFLASWLISSSRQIVIFFEIDHRILLQDASNTNKFIWGFRPGLTQTRLCTYRIWQEA